MPGSSKFYLPIHVGLTTVCAAVRRRSGHPPAAQGGAGWHGHIWRAWFAGTGAGCTRPRAPGRPAQSRTPGAGSRAAMRWRETGRGRSPVQPVRSAARAASAPARACRAQPIAQTGARADMIRCCRLGVPGAGSVMFLQLWQGPLPRNMASAEWRRDITNNYSFAVHHHSEWPAESCRRVAVLPQPA